MERQQQRRTPFLNGLFSTQGFDVPGGTVRFLDPTVAGRFGPTRPLALLANDVDDLFVDPGLLSVRVGSLGERTALELGFRYDQELSAPESAFAVVSSQPDEEGVRRSLEVLRVVSESRDPDDRVSASLVYGFISHQKTLPANDPESAVRIPAPTVGTGRGAGTTVRILDTGLAKRVAWPRAAKPATPRDIDPLDAVINPAFLGRAAGHGTFVAGLVHQLAPDAKIVVHAVANTEGLVDELTLRTTLDLIGPRNPADIVVLPFGGYAVKMGSFGTAALAPGSPDVWYDLPQVRGALERLVKRSPGTLIVASAGNNDSSDRCYPAAFCDDPNFCEHVVSVAGLDDAGYRYSYSNYGNWVTASALGVRLESMYVGGREDPANDPDGPGETFPTGGCAQWSGTSFSAPLVAGRVAEVLTALRAQFGSGVPATQAWAVVAAASRRQREGLCGVRVLVDGVAHD